MEETGCSQGVKCSTLGYVDLFSLFKAVKNCVLALFFFFLFNGNRFILLLLATLTSSAG